MKSRLVFLLTAWFSAVVFAAANPTISVQPTTGTYNVGPTAPLTEATGQAILAASGAAVAAIATAETKGVVSVTTTSAVVWTPTTATLSGNLQNPGTVTIWLSFGGTATAGQGTFILPNGQYTIDASNRFAGPISAVTASGTSSASWSDRH